MATNILVTGGAGYIGSHVCKELAQHGFTPITLDNFSMGHHWAVQWGPLVEGDILDAALLERTLGAHKVAAVMHFAGLTSVSESLLRPELYYRTNVLGSLNVAEAMRRAKVPAVVFSSSCAVYGQPNQVPIGESHRIVPTTPYGQSKAMAEQLLRDMGEAHGLRTVSLRYFNAAGADAQGDVGELHVPETHLLPLAMEAVQGGKEVLVHGNDYRTRDGTCVRDYIHVSDLAAVHVLALRRLLDGKIGGAYNLGNGEGFSVTEVLSAVQRVTGKRVPRAVGPRRQGDAVELIADATRARTELGFAPAHSSLDNIVKTAWSWSLKLQQEGRS